MPLIMFTTKIERSVTWPTIAVSPIATRIETIAIATGIRAATTAPKTSSRITIATGRPKASSPFSRSCCESSSKSSFTISSPVTVTRKSRSSACERTTCSSGETSPISVSGIATAWRSAETCRSPACAAWRPAATLSAWRRATKERKAGSGRVCRSERTTTISSTGRWSKRPLAKTASAARRDSGFPVRSPSELRSSSVAMHANDATRTASHASRVRFGWSAHARATERVDGTMRAYGRERCASTREDPDPSASTGPLAQASAQCPGDGENRGERCEDGDARAGGVRRDQEAREQRPERLRSSGEQGARRLDATEQVVRRARDAIAVDDGIGDRERETLENDRRGQDEHVRPDEEQNDAEAEIELGESNGSRRESSSGRTRNGRANEDAPAESSDEEPDFAAGESLTSRGDDEDEEEAGDRDVADGVEKCRVAEVGISPDVAEPLGEARAHRRRLALARLLESPSHREQEAGRRDVRSGVDHERNGVPDREQRAADGGPGDAHSGGPRLVDRERGGKLLGGDDRTERPHLRRVEEGVAGPFDERDEQDRPEQWVNEDEYGERGESDCADRVGGDHQATPVVPI